MTPALKHELERLIATLCDGELADAEHARLEALLRTDVDCRRLYLEYVDLHVRLLHHPRLAALLEPSGGASSLRPAAQGAATVEPDPRPAVDSQRAPRWWPYLATVAATLAASLMVQAWPLVGPAGREAAPGANAPAAASPVPAYVATLTKATDCSWLRPAAGRTGMRLLPGSLQLQSGRAELRFDGGAVLVVEGPVELVVESVTSALLVRGKALFRGDDAADSFDLHTPQATLVDYGTEYAVAVDAAHEEVHVFDGEVVRTPRQACDDAAKRVLNVAAGEARRFDAATGIAGRPVPLDAATFKICAECPPCDGDPDRELLAYEPFAYAAAALPCASRGTDELGWSGDWIRAVKCDAVTRFALVGDLWRPQMKSRRQGGAVATDRRGGLSRRWERPLRTDRDDVAYFSYLVRCERRTADAPCDLQVVLRDSRVGEPHRKWAVTVSWSAGKAAICWEGGGNCSSIPVEPGKTYLLAGKIVCGREAPDQTFLRLYAPRQRVDAEEPSSWTVVSRPVISGLTFDTVQVQFNTTMPLLLDELRFGSTWSSVTSPYALADADRATASVRD